MTYTRLDTIELCAGAGGKALGLAMAGFHHKALFELDAHACETMRRNRPEWPVVEHDLFEEFDYTPFQGVSLLAGGLPCPPFSMAGKQKGESDERNLFSIGVNIADKIRPRGILFENVKGMLNPKFDDYRDFIGQRLKRMGLISEWKLLYARDYGVAQLRPRAFMLALSEKDWEYHSWPEPSPTKQTVGSALVDLMSANGWHGAEKWAQNANKVAPTLVGGSKKHGGADLGPSRAREAWKKLGVNGKSLSEEAPCPDFTGDPRLTVRMAARLQGFPDNWEFNGKKTASYRQVGNALPPAVSRALGVSIRRAYELSDLVKKIEESAAK